MSLTAAVGWYAGDDGSLIAHGAPHRKGVSEKRRYFFDFEAIAEIVAGDTIEMNLPTSPTVICTGITIGDVGQNATILTRIEANLSAGTIDTEYSVKFTVNLTSGAIIARVGRLRISSI